MCGARENGEEQMAAQLFIFRALFTVTFDGLSSSLMTEPSVLASFIHSHPPPPQRAIIYSINWITPRDIIWDLNWINIVWGLHQTDLIFKIVDVTY